MKKYMALFFVVLCLSFVGCGRSYRAEGQNRFIVEYNEDHGLGGYIYIIKDTATDMRYLFVKSGYGGGLTVLEE